MSYYDDEPYYEPSLADELLMEYQLKMKNVLLDSVKNNIEKVKLENASLKTENNSLQIQVNKINQRERELEIQKQNLEREVRRERLSKLMEDFEVVMYRAYTTTENLPKCNKCNEKREITFTSPSGKEMTESCSCDKGITVYIPYEYICTEFKLDDRYNDKLLIWYKENHENNYDWYSYSSSNFVDTVYKDNMKFEELNSYKTYFKSKEECQKYCDWLNSDNPKTIKSELDTENCNDAKKKRKSS